MKNNIKMEKIKVIKDISYNGKFEGEVVDIDGYDPIDGTKAGYCEETGTRCEFKPQDEIEVLK